MVHRTSAVVQSHSPAVSAGRKMCFVVQNHLGKGARCAPPLHPPGLWLLQGIEPIPEPVERIAVPSLAGVWPPAPTTREEPPRSPKTPMAGETSLSPGPHRLRSVPAPETPDHFMETGKGAFALPFPWTHPIDQEPSCPLEP